jgi:acyl carrier protein
MNGDDLKGTIRGYIVGELLGDDAPSDLADDTPLLASGLVDSLGLEQLLYFLEDGFGVEFEDEDLSAENFQTIASIQTLLRRKLRSDGRAAASDGA